jgi:hypothetical protein
MGWSVGWDPNWRRWVGYGVPAWCDMPGCSAVIDRGLTYICGGEAMGGERGCGLYFCSTHLQALGQRCAQCANGLPPFDPKEDHPDWIEHISTHDSWAGYREKEPGYESYLRRVRKAES